MQIRFKTLTMLLLCAVICYIKLYADEPPLHSEPSFLRLVNDHWVNLTMEQMTLDEKIAQLKCLGVVPVPQSTLAPERRDAAFHRNAGTSECYTIFAACYQLCDFSKLIIEISFIDSTPGIFIS